MNTLFPVKHRSFLERLLMRLCQQGPLPSHIGFIMDGNRRYAKENHLETITGHMHGLEKMMDVWSLLREMGITQATMYAFSLDNFKRSREEVAKIMDLLREFLKVLLRELPRLIDEGIRLQLIGLPDLYEMVAPDIQQSIAQIVLATADCTGFTLTIAAGYSAQEEMVTAISDLQKAVCEKILQPEDITETTLSRALYTMGSAEPEILIRTSGVNRLSDFLLWQSNFSLIQFVTKFWPDYSALNFLAQILHFQVQSRLLAQGKQQMKGDLAKCDLQYCRQVWRQLNDGSLFSEFIKKRNQRIDQAIEWIRQKRLDVIRSFSNGSDIIQWDKYREKLNDGFITSMSPSAYLAFFPIPSYSELLTFCLLKNGPMPQHMAFIIDGNNRFSRKNNMKVMKGQELGCIKVGQVIFWQAMMGIRNATIFGFLPSHFTSRGNQMDHLNDLFAQMTGLLLEKVPHFEEGGVCIRYFGTLEHFPLELQKNFAKLALRTAHCTDFYVNFTFGYSTGDELAKAINDLKECVQLGIIKWTDINESTLTRTLDSLALPDPDIVTRTSGKTRMVDFLFWQNSFSYLSFPTELWPEYSIWSMFRDIFHFQAQFPSLSKGRQQAARTMQENDMAFCKEVNGKAKKRLSLEEFLEQRDARVGRAIEYIHEKRLDVLRKILEDSEP